MLSSKQHTEVFPCSEQQDPTSDTMEIVPPPLPSEIVPDPHLRVPHFQLPTSIEDKVESHVRRVVSTFEPGNYESYTRFNQLLSRFLAEADYIFVLTTKDCAFENFPALWINKSSCVNVRNFDTAYYRGETFDDHHARISNSHRTFVQIADAMSWGSLAVIEGDTVSYDAHDVELGALRSYKRLLSSDKAELIRFGYRPYFLEHTELTNCPKECECSLKLGGESMGGFGCVITSGICDMRSSDAYVLNARAFHPFERLLQQHTIDMEPMQNLSNVWLAIPQLAFQIDSAQTLEEQVRLSREFVRRCVRG